MSFKRSKSSTFQIQQKIDLRRFKCSPISIYIRISTPRTLQEERTAHSPGGAHRALSRRSAPRTLQEEHTTHSPGGAHRALSRRSAPRTLQEEHTAHSPGGAHRAFSHFPAKLYRILNKISCKALLNPSTRFPAKLY